MYKSDSSRFVFNSSAVGVAASITQPVKDSLTDQASATLGPSGGYAVQTRDKTDFRDIVRTGKVSVTVIGDDTPFDHVSLLATATVENLDILGVVKADAIVARIAAVYPKDKQADGTYKLRPFNPDDRFSPLKFQPQGSAIYGLKVAGKAFDPTVGDPFRDFPNDSTFKVSKQPTICEVFADTGGEQLYQVNGSQSYQVASNSVGTKLVCVGTAAGRAFLAIPEFGRIYIGELTVFRGKVALSMLRLELGCAITGVIDCGVVAISGDVVTPAGGLVLDFHIPDPTEVP